MALAISAIVSVASAKNNPNKLFKHQNFYLYYSNLQIECFYFYQKCKNHFENARLKGQKHASFAIRFLKNYILNQ